MSNFTNVHVPCHYTFEVGFRLVYCRMSNLGMARVGSLIFSHVDRLHVRVRK